ncbi:hypothetical protein VdG1_03601 [Verticillium dahliae VDG1]|nr:hypothetical protein VdG1_03601 [Verticillium dahliae VDG1]
MSLTNHWPEYMRLEEAVHREDDLFGPLLAESINLSSLPPGHSHGQDDVFLDMDPEAAALCQSAPVDLPDLDFTLPTYFDTRLARMEASVNETASALARMEATMNETASAFQGLLPRAHGAMQNLIDIAILFDENMEKLKQSMGLFARGIVEHFFGDATLADAETFSSCDP